MRKLTIEPIGHVVQPLKRLPIRNGTKDMLSEVLIYKKYSSGLEGIEEYSHVYILFWLHKLPQKDRMKLQLHPHGEEVLPLVGVFATRFPPRPNPIGLTLVEIVMRQDNTLLVRGLDAANRSPVLDIKPRDYFEQLERVRVPEWWQRIFGNDAQKHSSHDH